MRTTTTLTLCTLALLGLGLAPTVAADAGAEAGHDWNCALTVGDTGVVCLGYWYCTESYCALPTCVLRNPDVLCI